MPDGAAGRGGGKPPPSAVGLAYIAAERPLKRFISRFCTNRADVDDIAQNALVSAMDAEASRLIDNPKAYLYTTARNLAIRTHREKAREIVAYVDGLDLAEAPSAAPSQEDAIISRERLELMCEALETLSPNCRRVFVMRKVYGYSHKEIADSLGLAVSTVEKHLAAGFERCAAFMRGREASQQSEAAASIAMLDSRKAARRQ